MEDSTSIYMRDVGKHKLLDNEETNRLLKKAQGGDLAARDRIILHNMRWVIRISRKYSGRGLDQGELISEGVLGLTHAVKKCDPTKAKFSTYCTYWVENYMDRACMDKGRTIRIPIHRSKEHTKINKFKQRYKNEVGIMPTIEQISKVVDKDADAVRALVDENQSILSLDYQPPSHDTSEASYDSFIDFLKSNDEEHDVIIDKDRQVIKLTDHVNSLPARQKEVICLRFGLNGYDIHTFEKAGEVLSLSRERVRQIQVAALATLKSLVTA